MSSAALTFHHAYDLDPGASAKVSFLRRGNTYNIELASYSGTLNSGMPNVVNDIELDMSPYIGLNNMRIRFEFDSPTTCSVWAIDNILLPSPPPDVTYQWGPIEYFPGGEGEVVVVLPSTTTDYTLTVYIAGCPDQQITHSLLWSTILLSLLPMPAWEASPVTFIQTNGPAGGTWSVTEVEQLIATGVFTATDPGCYVATYTTVSGDCSGSASFVVFPAAPMPDVNPGCGPIVVTPPPSVYGFDIEYSFNDGATWGANTPPTADNCSGYHIRTRYILSLACDSISAGEVSSDPVCSESPVVIRPIDSAAPTFTVPADITISKDANCNYDASVGVTGDVTDEADNCAVGLNATYSDVTIPGACEGEVRIERTWFLEDECGNQTVQIQTITVADNNEGPTFTVPADITINRDADCNYNALPVMTGDVTDAADNCSVILDITYSDVLVESACEATITRTWTVTDDCGNATVKDQIITVADDIDPTITCPADITVQCIDDVPAPDISLVTATDNCSGVTVTFEGDVSDGNTCPEIITRTYRATDGCGNFVECTQTITVDDTTAPVISPQASDGQVDCISGDPDSDPTYLAWLNDRAGARATDNCTDSILLVWTSNVSTQTWSGTPGNNQITITWTVTDDCGNSDQTTATFIIADDIPPTISCPSNVQDTAAPNNCAKIPAALTDPVYDDVCSTPVLTYRMTGATTGTGSGSVTGFSFNVGVTTVTYIVTDGAGLQDSCSFTVTIVDVTPPNIEITNCVSVTGTMDADDCVALPPALVDPLYEDDCWPVDSLVLSFTITGAWDTTGFGYVSGFMFPVGVSTVTYTVTDPDGNKAECSFTVTMLRDAIPSTAINCPPNPAPVTLGASECEALITLAPPTITEVCTTAVYTITNNINGGSTIVDEIFETGITRVVWYIEDNSGNIDSCIVFVEVNGVQLPTITCPPSVSATMSADDCYAIPPTIGSPTLNAPCWDIDSLDLTFRIINGSWDTTGVGEVNGLQFPSGVNTVWYIVTDPDGNKDSCSFTVSMLRDAIPSTAINCPPNPAPVTLGASECEALITLAPPTITEVCTTAVYTITNNINGGSTIVDEIFETGITRVVWYIEDNSGNIDSCIVFVEVNGVQLPTITCPPSVSATMSADDCYAIPPTIGSPTLNAPCWDIDSLDLTFRIINGSWDTTGVGEVNGLQFPSGVNTVWYIVTDPDGNKDSCSFTVSMLRDAFRQQRLTVRQTRRL